MVDWQVALDWLVGIVTLGVGWMLKRMASQERRISDLERLVAGQYITRAEFATTIDSLREERHRTSAEMLTWLRRIDDKLDRKADKE